jgi:hypothetical protein
LNKSEIILGKITFDSLWDNFRECYLDKYLESECGETNNEGTKKSFRAKANTAFANFTFKKRNEFIEECKLKGEIWNQNKYPYNKNWIVNDSGIKKTLVRYPKLLDIIHFIDKQSCFVKSVDGKSLVVKKKDWNEKRQISCLCVNKKFYERAELELDLQQITMQKYIQAFCKIGILKMVEHHKLSGRATVYSDGYYYSGFSGKDKKHWMREKKHHKALREFSY